MGFRVPVQMTKFFTDERSFSYVYVHEKFKSIRQLELYLIDTFSLEGELCLMKENYLLPSCESINIVKADEMITVSPLQSPFTFIDKAYSSNKEIPPLEEVTENVEKEAKKKKRKKNKESTQEISTVDFDIDEKLPNKENVSLNCSSASPIKTKVLDNPEVFTAIKNIEEYHSKFKQKKSEEEEVEAMKSKALNALKDFFPTNVNGVSDGRIKKRKRIRIRKSKKSNQVEYLQSDSESTITQNNKSLVLTTGKINSHVRFTQSVEKPVTILQNEIVTQKNDKKPRIVRAIQPDIASINTTNGVKHFDKVTSSESAKNFFPDFISFSSSDKLNSHENVSQNGGSYPSLSNILKELDNYPIINNMSLESDAVIVFKMLKMGEDYAPIISDFILGKVISCDLDSQSIQLAILDGHEECITPSGKFELDQDDDDAKVDSLPVVIDVSWDQLLEPRLFHN